jgi:predicted nucleotidyltransferase
MKIEDIIENKEKRRRKLGKNLHNIVLQLKKFGALKVILFGSFASGDISLTSDLDLVAVMPASKAGRDWLKQIYEEIKRDVSCDILVFNSKEFEDLKDKRVILREAIEKGKVIYEKGS